MRWLWKMAALPVMIMIKLFCFVGNLITNLSSYVIGLGLLFLAGCSVYCLLRGEWVEVALLVGIAAVGFLALFLAVFLLVTVENLGNRLSDFMRM